MYKTKLQQLQKEISILKRRRKNRFKENQQAIVNFVNGLTKEANLKVKNTEIILRRGDKNKGFEHFLVRHYKEPNNGEITAEDIINIDLIYKNGLKDSSDTRNGFQIYNQIKFDKQLRLVLNPTEDGKFIVTTYKVT